MNSILFHTILSASQGWTGLIFRNPDHGTVWTANLFIPYLQRFNPPRIGCFSLIDHDPTPHFLDLNCCQPIPAEEHLKTIRRPPHPWRTTTPHFLDLHSPIKLKQLDSCQSLKDPAMLQTTIPVEMVKLERTTEQLR